MTDTGVISIDKIRLVIFSGAFFATMSRTNVTTDTAAMTSAKTETFISLNVYPKHAASIVPAGYSAVNAKSAYIKIDVVLFI